MRPDMRTLSALAAASLVVAGCASMTKGGARARADACQDRTVQIYFEPDVAEVTPEGRAVLKAAARGARRCKVAAVEVVGLADAVGAADANLELSQRRAEAVAAALREVGLPAAAFQLAAAGEAGAVTRAGEARPLRRRADVLLRLQRP